MPVSRSSVRPPACSVIFNLFGVRCRLFSALLVVGLAALLLVPVNARAAATYSVNATTDTGTGSGTTGDLRYAITQAELAANVGSTIVFDSSVFGSTITLTSALPAITQDTTITGPGADKLTIDGVNSYQVFKITGGTVAISGLTIANGKSGNLGAGIQNAGTLLTVSDCVFSGGLAVDGGAIATTGALTVSGSTFLRNTASSAFGTAGAIYATSGTVKVTNSTFYANSSDRTGGGIFQLAGTLAIANSVFYGNTSGTGGAIATGNVTLRLVNNVFAGNSADDGGGIFSIAPTITESHNLFFNNSNGDANITLSGTDLIGQDPMLLPLGNYGGKTLTMLPLPGSPAISKGTATLPSPLTLPSTDQRGFTLDSSAVDMGAVQTNYLMVTTATDSDDGSCTTTTCSLRDAINAANTVGGDIGFNSSLAGSTITLASAPPEITGQVEIVGLGADQLTVSGGNSSTVGAVFSVGSGAQASIYGLTITGGKSTADGGGISNAGTLTVSASALTSNTAANGGGIENSGTLMVASSTLSDNTSSGDGGGIYNAGSLFVTNSTLYSNGATGAGGALATSGVADVSNSTFGGNSAGSSGGGISNSSSGISIVNDNIFDTNVAATIGGAIENAGTADANYNIYYNNQANGLINDCSGCSSNDNAVTASSEPLAALGSYGGPTQTMLPLPITTGALCAGSASAAVDANGNPLTTDQRGFAMGVSSYCASGSIDAGAVQTNYTSVQFANDTSGTTGTTTYSALINQAVAPAPVVSVTENGQNIGGVPITLTFTPTSGTPTATGLGPVTTVAGTGATFSSIKVDTAGVSDSLGVSLPVGSSNLTASADLEIDGLVALSPASGALTGGSVGTAYSKSISGTGGKSPYTYEVSTGALPDGITLNTSTGLLSGTPTKAGDFSFSIQVTDKKSRTGSASYTLKISQAVTSIAVSSADTTTTSEPSGESFVGDSVTFTASLTPVGKNVTFAKGVAFSLDGSAVASCTSQTVTVASDGSTAKATCVIADLTKGSHTVVASYPTGDLNYGSATSVDFTQTVSLISTSVTVASSKNPSNVNDSVQFTATVTKGSGSADPTGGTVAFTSDGVTIPGCGTEGLTSGKASCTTTALTAAASPHKIVATYSGDSSTFDTSASTQLSQTVNKASTAVTVTSSGTPGVNQQTILTATVSPTSPVALGSGTVAFSDGSTAISGCGAQAVTAATGKATCTAAFTNAGSHTISAVYSGDANYSATTSGNITTLSLSVSKVDTSVSIASVDNTTAGLGANTSNLNDSVTFTATVAPSTPVTGATALSGKVSFTSNGQTVCGAAPGTWDSTAQTYQVTCTTSTLQAGSASIVATYSNDSNYNGSSNNLTQTVNTLATTTSLTSSTGGTSTVNQAVTFTASVTPFSNVVKLSGAVTFTATNTSTSAVTTLCNAVGITASTGVATCVASSLTPGAYTISASYGSDSNYNSSSGTVSQTVGQASTSISLTSSPNPSTINQQVTLSATVTAPSGATALNGKVSFTDNGNAIADCPAATINPNDPTVTCKTSSLAYGTHSIMASYGSDPNFSDSSSTAVSQTVNAAPTTTSLTSSTGSSSTVDQSVNFTATVSGASGAVQFSGAMSFTDNGTAIPGCSSMPVGATTGSAVCTTSALPSGSHAISVSYTGDTNFSTSGNSLTLQVNPGASNTTVVSSLNPSVALNPKNYQDTVEFTATVGPTAGVPLSGSVTFTNNGAPIAECQSAVPVNPATGTAACLTASLGFGSHTILAVYNGDPNFNSSSGSVAQTVQDYTLAASATQTVTVSQRFTNSTDPFTPQAITVSAAPISGFAGKLDLTCNVVPLSAPDGAVSPVCSLGSSTLDVTASGQQQPVALTIDAGSGSTPVATTGTYDVSIIGVDETTGLTHASASFVVNVRYQAAPLTIVSGATSGNSSTVGFTLPPNVGLSDILCSSVTGPTLTSPVAPVALSMSCTFSPSTVPPTGTSQDAVVTVTVNTGAATEAQLHDSTTTVAMAGMVGLPILLLLGFAPGAKSRKVFFRYLGIVLAAALLFTGTGCGGGQFTAPPSVSGQTPPGSYNILVQGTGTDGQVYQAVVQVNVTR